MAVTPPEQRIWWNEPIHGIELGWIVIAFLWGLFMFFFMIAWHFIGEQNLSTETYRISPTKYEEKVEAFAEQYGVGEENGVPVVRPPAGEDVYLLARLWEFRPILERLLGRSVPVSSSDWRPGDQRVYISDVRKAERELGWRPQMGVNEGIRRLYDWVIANRDLFASPEILP